MSHYLYLTLDILSIAFPLMFSFHRKAHFARHWKAFVPAILIPALVFVLWDNWFTSMGVWGFNPKYVTGIYLGHLPVEEVLFFICIPYACLFTYEAVNYFKPIDYNPARISAVLIVGLTLSGIKYYDRWYPAVTFISLAVFLLVLVFMVKPDYLGKFYFAFLFILIPFFIINGILTGTGLPEPVVWYNNEENLGIRVLTIPIEDTFYGMLLLLGNVVIYEALKRRGVKHIGT